MPKQILLIFVLLLLASLLLGACAGIQTSESAPVDFTPATPEIAVTLPASSTPVPVPTETPLTVAEVAPAPILDKISATKADPTEEEPDLIPLEATSTPRPASNVVAAVPTPQPTALTATPTSLPNPTVAPISTRTPEESHESATQPASSLSQIETTVFYQQNGLTLEYYWPLDAGGNLSAAETEILAYNQGDEVIEFRPPTIAFTENGKPLAQLSGIWEKFPSQYSWDRIEIIQIPPSPYRGEPLLVHPGEKAKLHWHQESVASSDTNQSLGLELTVTTGVLTEIISRTLVRNSEQPDINIAAAPEPTQKPHEFRQSTGNGVPVGTTSGVIWSFSGITWSPNGTPPDCADPFVV